MGKLVRDKIPQVIQDAGKTVTTRVLDDAEYTKELQEKLQEEVQEYLDEPSVEELADILEVLYHPGDRNEIEQARAAKESERGAFQKKIFLEKVD